MLPTIGQPEKAEQPEQTAAEPSRQPGSDRAVQARLTQTERSLSLARQWAAAHHAEHEEALIEYLALLFRYLKSSKGPNDPTWFKVRSHGSVPRHNFATLFQKIKTHNPEIKRQIIANPRQFALSVLQLLSLNPDRKLHPPKPEEVNTRAYAKCHAKQPSQLDWILAQVTPSAQVPLCGWEFETAVMVRRPEAVGIGAWAVEFSDKETISDRGLWSWTAELTEAGWVLEAVLKPQPLNVQGHERVTQAVTEMLRDLENWRRLPLMAELKSDKGTSYRLDVRADDLEEFGVAPQFTMGIPMEKMEAAFTGLSTCDLSEADQALLHGIDTTDPEEQAEGFALFSRSSIGQISKDMLGDRDDTFGHIQQNARCWAERFEAQGETALIGFVSLVMRYLNFGAQCEGPYLKSRVGGLMARTDMAAYFRAIQTRDPKIKDRIVADPAAFACSIFEVIGLAPDEKLFTQDSMFSHDKRTQVSRIDWLRGLVRADCLPGSLLTSSLRRQLHTQRQRNHVPSVDLASAAASPSAFLGLGAYADKMDPGNAVICEFRLLQNRNTSELLSAIDSMQHFAMQLADPDTSVIPRYEVEAYRLPLIWARRGRDPANHTARSQVFAANRPVDAAAIAEGELKSGPLLACLISQIERGDADAVARLNPRLAELAGIPSLGLNVRLPVDLSSRELIGASPAAVGRSEDLWFKHLMKSGIEADSPAHFRQPAELLNPQCEVLQFSKEQLSDSTGIEHFAACLARARCVTATMQKVPDARWPVDTLFNNEVRGGVQFGQTYAIENGSRADALILRNPKQWKVLSDPSSAVMVDLPNPLLLTTEQFLRVVDFVTIAVPHAPPVRGKSTSAASSQVAK